jgi:hypothetical protein
MCHRRSRDFLLIRATAAKHRNATGCGISETTGLPRQNVTYDTLNV